MNEEVRKAREAAEAAKNQLRYGAISLDEAKRRVAPYIKLVNEGGKRLSKQYKNPFRKVSDTGFLR